MNALFGRLIKSWLQILLPEYTMSQDHGDGTNG
jgi:hypothetical protein